VPAFSHVPRKRTTSTSTSVTSSRSNTVLGPWLSSWACKVSRCTACRWPISRSVVWCPSVCRSILHVICVVSFLASALSVTVDERSYCKNETIHNLLMYLRFDGGGSADTSAIAEGSAPMISTTVHGAGSDRSCMNNTRRFIQQVCANT